MLRLRQVVLCILVITLPAACDKPPTAPSPAPAVIEVSVAAPAVYVGATTRATAVVRDQHGQPMTAQAVTWSSSDTSQATISSTGEITALAAGEVTIRATAGPAAGSVGLTITHDPNKAARVVISPDTASVLLGQRRTFAAKVFNALGDEFTGRTITWSSSDSRVAELHSQGIATAVNAGRARIIATVEGVSASVPFLATVHPLKRTSYENAKEIGASPINAPHTMTRARGDFAGTGELGVFIAHSTYTAPGEYIFYRTDQNGLVRDSRVRVDSAGVAPCIHPRKVLIADFNGDKLPDLFLVCHGLDVPPFPGERNQILLSAGVAKYRLQYTSQDVGFWHGASAADLDGDGDIDVVVAGQKIRRFNNNGDGTFTMTTKGVPQGDQFYSVEIADVDEDGRLDLIAGGHEWDRWGAVPTAVWLNPGNGDFSAVQPIIIDAVQNEAVVLDFLLTGTGATRTLWVLRTSGGEDGVFYQGATLQRFNVRTRTAEVVVKRRPGQWVPWIIKYERAGRTHVGSDETSTPLEVEIPQLGDRVW